MFGFDIADRARHRRAALLQDLEHHVLFGVVALVGEILEVLDDRLEDLVIRPLAAIEHLELLLENIDQLRDVAMLFLQHFDHTGH